MGLAAAAWTAVAALSFLLGSLPTGVLLARLRGVDPRAAGSGNVGATNVARTAGRLLGLATLALDGAKGALAVFLAERAALAAGGAPLAWGASAAVAAVLGHAYSPALGFRGGKGVATSLGALAALAPIVLAAPLAAFALVFAPSRRVSAGSVAAALAALPGAAAVAEPPPVLAATAALSALILVRHRENIARLRAGTEPRFRSRGGRRRLPGD